MLEDIKKLLRVRRLRFTRAIKKARCHKENYRFVNTIKEVR